MPLAFPTARKPPFGLKARECTKCRGDRPVGQLENTVMEGTCSRRMESFFMREANAWRVGRGGRLSYVREETRPNSKKEL